MDSRIFNILFVDIETAAEHSSFEQVPDRLKEHWKRKASFLNKDIEVSPAELYEEKAAIYAEYGKVICVGIGGFYLNKKGELCFKSRSLIRKYQYLQSEKHFR